MIMKCDSFENIANDIKRGQKKIVMFGAGTLGMITAPEILSEQGLNEYVICYIDNDSRKWNTVIETAIGVKKIYSPDYLVNFINQDIVIMINVSRYYEVLKQLEGTGYTQNMECYLTAMLCIYNFGQSGNQGVIKKSISPMIPKVIHYMWLGNKELPDELKSCLDSWKKYCPEYQIICWNENNYDIEKNEYMRQAYQKKAFGFIPDYARLDILYHHGGIYLDTDVELLRSLDELLYQKSFCGVEKWQIINFGGCSGAVKGDPMIKKFLDARESLMYINRDGTENQNTCGFYDTAVALKNGYRFTGKNQEVSGMTIYSSDYFHPYDYMSGRTAITADTFSIHHFSGGWLSEKQKAANRRAIEEFDRIYRLAGKA